MLDLDALFDTVARSAFRLETLPLTGQPVDAQDLAWHLPWFGPIRRAVDGGRVVQRVRVIDRPPTPYQRFELSLAPFHEDAGEDLRILGAPAARELGLPPLNFWLLDDQRVVSLEIGDDGTFGGSQVTADRAVLNRMRRLRDLAWRHATPYRGFVG
jgi:hypothetical protein